jgi:hypothetical protein
MIVVQLHLQRLTGEGEIAGRIDNNGDPLASSGTGPARVYCSAPESRIGTGRPAGPGTATARRLVAKGRERASDDPGGTNVDRDGTTGGGASQAESGRIGPRGRPDEADPCVRTGWLIPAEYALSMLSVLSPLGNKDD